MSVATEETISLDDLGAHHDDGLVHWYEPGAEKCLCGAKLGGEVDDSVEVDCVVCIYLDSVLP